METATDNQADGLNRLFRAVSGEHDPAFCDECRALLPELVEAEMAGEDVAALYPTVLDHLDTCADCDAEYAVLLDLALTEERGELPQPATYPDLKLPQPVLVRRFVRRLAQAVLDTLAPQHAQELAVVAKTFFEQLAGAVGRLTLQESPSLPMGLGGQRSETLPTVMAAYYAVATLLEKYTAAELQVLSEKGALENVLRQIARDEAKRHDLRGKAEKVFVDGLVKETLADLPTLLALASGGKQV